MRTHIYSRNASSAEHIDGDGEEENVRCKELHAEHAHRRMREERRIRAHESKSDATRAKRAESLCSAAAAETAGECAAEERCGG